MSDDAARGPDLPAAEEGPAPGAPELPDVPPPEPTGDPRVDAALARLGELGARPVPEHVEIYEDVHRRLQGLLASAESAESADPSDPSDMAGPGGPPGGPGAGGPARPRPAFPDALRPRP